MDLRQEHQVQYHSGLALPADTHISFTSKQRPPRRRIHGHHASDSVLTFEGDTYNTLR